MRRRGVGVDAGRTRLRQESGDAAQKYLRRIVAAARQTALAKHAGLNIGAAQNDVDLLLDKVGGAFLDHQHRAFAGAELLYLLRHQGIGDIEYIDWNA